MLVVGLLTVLAAGVGIGVAATHGGQAAVDEPQYLLSALSLWEDHDLDISDELADRRFLAFHDADLPVQTAVRPDGSQLSPHDPLLPVLLAVPMGLGGWVAAKLTLAVLAGVLAALLLWVAVRRFAVPPRLAVPGVALATCTAPLAVYGQQVYPELPGALAALVAVAALTAPRPTPRTLTVLALAIVALPWLSVKYAPVAAALYLVAAIGLWRAHRRRAAAVLTGGLAAGGIVYLAAHKAIYGGITAYASGDHFQGSGEFGVVGFHPNYPGRSIRLLGLLVDRDFGIAAWQPAWFLVIPAFVALLGARPRHWPALAVPLLAGWATATWVALTMQGYWWPGRQLVVVLPLAVLVILVWLARARRAVVVSRPRSPSPASATTPRWSSPATCPTRPGCWRRTTWPCTGRPRCCCPTTATSPPPTWSGTRPGWWSQWSQWSQRCSRCVPPAVPVERQRHPERHAEQVRGQHVVDQPRRDDEAVAQQQAVRDAGRDLLDVVGDQHHGRRVRVGGQRGQPADQLLPPGQVEPGRRLVEQQQLRVGHQRPGDLHPLALALATACRTGGRPGPARRAGRAGAGPGRCRARRIPRASGRPPRSRR